eukprot:GHVQ01026976.1.p1 GENE.GHVQ01026976.1~~GHVQ01026976.1.p1  ORF type:complete len:154 (+),score=9.60 GHVQ01026976.1:107-568(+)
MLSPRHLRIMPPHAITHRKYYVKWDRPHGVMGPYTQQQQKRHHRDLGPALPMPTVFPKSRCLSLWGWGKCSLLPHELRSHSVDRITDACRSTSFHTTTCNKFMARVTDVSLHNSQAKNSMYRQIAGSLESQQQRQKKSCIRKRLMKPLRCKSL